jgi:NitT/TauT family transport system substrate-binding protein
MNTFQPSKRQSLISAVKLGVSVATLRFGTPALASDDKKLMIGYWPIAAGLPFFTAMERGLFKDAGVTVEAVKFASPSQVVEAMMAGRIDGCANGVAITALALADAQEPGNIKFTCVNFANDKYVLDEVIVPIGSTVKNISDLSGKKVACGPGINNVTLAKAVMLGGGAKDVRVVELPIAQILPSLSAGQVEAAYILEPTGVIGTQEKISRTLATGVVTKYVLKDNLPWIGGAAALTATTLKNKASLVPGYLSGYSAGLAYVRKEGLKANQYLTGYTAIEGELAKAVPLSGYIDHTEVKPTDVHALQKLFDIFAEKKVFENSISANALFYK